MNNSFEKWYLTLLNEWIDKKTTDYELYNILSLWIVSIEKYLKKPIDLKPLLENIEKFGIQKIKSILKQEIKYFDKLPKDIQSFLNS